MGQQGEIHDVAGGAWIIVDASHDRFGGTADVHCAPILSLPELRFALDVDIGSDVTAAADQMHLGLPDSRFGGFVSLGLIRKHPKTKLTARSVLGRAHSLQVDEIRRNLVTWFSVFSYDYDTVRRLPAAPETTPAIYPGMIFSARGERVCVIDHWGCFNEYPLLYVAPIFSDVAAPTPLDVDISIEYLHLFGRRHFVRTNEFFLVDREELKPVDDKLPPQMLGYGLLRRITRAMILKFGQTSLLL